MAEFALAFDYQIPQQLGVIERKYHSLIRQTIEDQLRYQPDVETRNRKPLQRPLDFGSGWEIRFGPDNRFRVFYRVDTQAQTVRILAIGVKIGNRLFIGGEEVEE